MDIELLIKSVMGLVIILGFLIFLLFYIFPEPKKDEPKKKVIKKNNIDNNIDISLLGLKKIIKNRISNTKQLSDALNLIIKHHGTVTKKTAGRSHKDFDIYMDILFTICRHPNTNKDIIIKFDKELTQKNPEYRSDINDAITKGLNSRRIS